LLDTIAICLCWNTFNMLLVICCLGVVWERRQLRASHRYITREPVRLLDPQSGARVTARLRDLSTTGIGLTLDSREARLSSHLRLQGVDSYGNRHDLPIQVVRVDDAGGRPTLGGRFETGDAAVRRQVIGFVYGDSGRWKYFTEGRGEKGIGTIRAFFKLVRIGLKGMWRHAAGLTRVGIRRIRRPAETA
jgi:cellulose synthase (UDP-forming)